MKRVMPKLFAIVTIMFAFTAPVFAFASTEVVFTEADTCSVNYIHDDGGQYLGCETCINGHCAFSDESRMTECGCCTFCAAARQYVNEETRERAMARDYERCQKEGHCQTPRVEL